MENARDLQLGAFGLSELNTNLQLPLYQRLIKPRFKGGFPSSHVVMVTCKDEHDITKWQGVVLLAAALGHERRIINYGGGPDGIGSFTYVMMDAP